MGRAHIALCMLGVAAAQQAGTAVTEAPPPVALQRCSKGRGCAPERAVATMDANWRWVHEAGGWKNCFTDGNWSDEFCPDPKACAAKCAVEGIDAKGYAQTYGVGAIPAGLELRYVADSGNVGSRVYLTDGADSYKVFKLKNREFAFDVDVSSLTCGINGAVYFIEMDAAGGKGVGSNTAGAKYGVGYCDAQCPHDVKWVAGEANMHGAYGACCTEMDIWEANSLAAQFTSHPCTVKGAHRCQGVECGDSDKGDRFRGVCDKDGCDFNPYRMGSHGYFGPGENFTVDSRRPMTVVTQFVTENHTDQGDLIEIRRLYVQGGKVIADARSMTQGVDGDSITDAFCSAQKTAFEDPNDHQRKGGLKRMGEALDRGLVLALSIWDDAATEMRWLDSWFPANDTATRAGVTRGPCEPGAGRAADARAAHKAASVKYTNIRYGDIGSTFPAAGGRRLTAALV